MPRSGKAPQREAWEKGPLFLCIGGQDGGQPVLKLVPLVLFPPSLAYLPHFKSDFTAQERAAQQMRSLHIACCWFYQVYFGRPLLEIGA